MGGEGSTGVFILVGGLFIRPLSHVTGLPCDCRSYIKEAEIYFFYLFYLIKFTFHVIRRLYAEEKWQYISQLIVSVIAFFLDLISLCSFWGSAAFSRQIVRWRTPAFSGSAIKIVKGFRRVTTVVDFIFFFL